MGKLLIIGAGAAGSVVAQKAARLPHYFEKIHLASRTLSKCLDINKKCDGRLSVSKIDADNSSEVSALIRDFKPELVINMALPYQDLSIMDACLETGVHYLDTANYEPLDEAKFSYTWQWDYHDRFKDKGIMAVLGCGFDPGMTSIYSAYANKDLFDVVESIDILDCNAGDHGHPFATNFNPEINIREITQRGKYFENGQWKETDPLSLSMDFDFPEVGVKKAYLMYHEELESLAKFIPGINRLRFWMTFSESYLTHLKVLENVGLTRIDSIKFEGKDIVPIKFLKELLPEPSSLASRYKGKTCIGCLVSGIKEGDPKKMFIYNVCDHEETYKDVGAQAISFTTGVPAMVGAIMVMTKKWEGRGVFNVEQFDPTPFLDCIGEYGLPWKIKEIHE